MGGKKKVRVICNPSQVLVDEEFIIRVVGLNPRDCLTIHSVVREGKMTFTACGCYLADNNGNVDVTKDLSLGGSYSGVEPMGLIWSMEQAPGQRSGLRLRINDVSKPQIVRFYIYKDHHGLKDIYDKGLIALATTEVKRYYKAEDVSRIPVTDKNIRGILFIPQGQGRCPGVIDVFGGEGGLHEHRSSLLGSKGFTVLSLAFMGYKDLPKTFCDVSIDYFKEAVSFLYNHPSVIPGGIGMVGISKGGECVQIAALRCPEVKAIVNVSGPPCLTIPLLGGVEDLLLNKGLDPQYFVPTNEGVKMKDSFQKITARDIIPLWKTDVKVFTICGSDDQAVDPNIYKMQYEAFPLTKRKNMELVMYKNAGHLIEPPHSPLYKTSYFSPMGRLVLMGGKAKEHALAQEGSWRRMIIFLRKHLPSNEKTTKSLL